MNKILNFTFRGKYYQVNEKGHIKANGLSDFSDQWVFLGGSSHHWHSSIEIELADAFKCPELLNGCLGWDKDHGTVRRWGGKYCGKLPRITRAYIS